MTVVDYYDLRPVDWASGKRLPLEPGAGNICDRCQAEHAVVFVLQDLETQKIYKVGSTCAQRSFGFEPELDAEGKKLIKNAKLQKEIELNQLRLTKIADVVPVIARSVVNTPQPDVVLSETKTTNWRTDQDLIHVWKMGSTTQWQQPWMSEREAFGMFYTTQTVLDKT